MLEILGMESIDTVLKICRPIKAVVEAGVEIGIVVGGGNFWRGRSSGKMNRMRADHMGMLGTVINALGVADGLEQLGVPVRVQTAIAMQQGCRAVYPESGGPAFGKRPCRRFWLRNRKSVFLDGYCCGAPCGGNRSRYYFESYHGRWCL